MPSDTAVVAVPVTAPPKNPLVSKTMIVNLIVALIGAGTALVAPDTLAQLSPQVITWIVTAVAAGNMLLRTLTVQPVSFSGPFRSAAIAGVVGSVIAAAASAVPHSASAGDGGTTVAIVFPDSSATYVVALDGKGAANVSLVGKIIWVAPGPGPTPVPPAPPPTPTPTPTPNPTPPPAPNSRVASFTDAAQRVVGDPNRAETAQGLAELYRRIAPLALLATPAAMEAAVQKANDDYLATRGPQAAQAWQTFRDELSKQWSILLVTRGTTMADYSSLLNDAAKGLDGSVVNQRSIDPATLQLILSIVLEILKMLKP